MNHIDFSDQVLKLIEDKAYSTDLITDIGVTQEQYQQRMKYYFSIPQPAQKSQEWLNQRHNYITASAFANTLTARWNVSRTDLLKEKVSWGAYRTFFGNEATRWGEKYEDVANAIYCYRMNVKVDEYGLIPHFREDLKFLGASTDGISSKLINLEIKCPFSRIIKPGAVKPIYEKQMQLQMSTLDLPLTHFLECTFEEYRTEKDFWIDFNYPSQNPEKGIIIELVDYEQANLAGEPKMVYWYSPIEFCTQQNKLKFWHLQQINKILASTTFIYIRSHFWFLKTHSCINVPRKTEWFNEQIPLAKAFWDEVTYYRTHGGMEEIEQDWTSFKANNQSPEPSPPPIARGRCLLGSGNDSSGNDSSDDKQNKQKTKPITGLSSNSRCLLANESSDDELPIPSKSLLSDQTDSASIGSESSDDVFPEADVIENAVIENVVENVFNDSSDEEGDSPPVRPLNAKPKQKSYFKKK